MPVALTLPTAQWCGLLTSEVTTDRLDDAEVIQGEIGDPHHSGGVVVGHNGGTEELAETARRETDVEDDTVVDGQTHQLVQVKDSTRLMSDPTLHTHTHYTLHTYTLTCNTLTCSTLTSNTLTCNTFTCNTHTAQQG